MSSRTFVWVINGIGAGVNCGVAAFNFATHSPWLACGNLCAAAFIVVVAVSLRPGLRPGQIIHANHGGEAVYTSEAIEKARLNLLRAVKTTGAKAIQGEPGGARGMYRLHSHGFVFDIDAGYIRNRNERDVTCYQTMASMPREEKIASALILLHNNPKLWFRWKTEAGG